MKTWIISFIIVAVPIVGGSSENQLSPLLHLRKIKMRLVAQDLTHKEQRWLSHKQMVCKSAQDIESCLRQAFREKLQSYLKNPAFYGRAVEFTNSLLFLQPYSRPVERLREENVQSVNEVGLPSEFDNKTSNDSLGHLAWNIFSQNQSWRNFFISGDLTVSESEYFNTFIPQQAKPLRRGQSAKIQITNSDIAAGFITTPRFLFRNFNNPVNEGRKRAAAILRVALCDAMFPAIERGDEHKELENLIALGQARPAVSGGNAGLHGTRRDCAQCHVYRGLDHMAWTFRSIELTLSDRPSSGRFTYLRANGELVDVPVRGIGHLAQILVQQPEFVDCQVRNFWSHYVGPVRYLDENPDRQKQLTDLYKSVDGRVKDFITELLMQPEFSQRHLPKRTINPLFANAERVLKNCNQCHQGFLPSFTQFPIGKDGQNLTSHFVARIIERLALRPLAKTDTRTMPPASSAWQPREEDLKAVLDWIRAGVPDAQGVQQINGADLKTIGVENE